MRQTSEEQHPLDPEWLRMFTVFLNENCDKKKFEIIKRIFVETYFTNISNGLNPMEAMEKAKMTALCFLIELR